MFISTEDGRIINSTHVVSAEMPRGGAGFFVTFTDGRKERLLLAVADLEELCGTIVPAPTGYMVFEVHIPAAADAARGLLCLDPRPVIAFRVTDSAARPVPITAAGAASTSGGWTYAVRGPEGRWIGPDDDYERAADFKAACERQLADTLARHPRKAA
ncbi:hypothetical protein SAMN02799631_05896 [Methylobacterium sp. 174MFSha1.1]|uniref:hypothetical protein n=1 Tax=Methylobacterium sp. 174MFSha1.1 TaxID=1502749 RepID=UPI0008E55775|nr:hypothetical protein [Methylobacterium sp. 174MFSha1.1]SFV14536.1 hypothetical protein SAMN02799631_05896 [Methylobacterium sp. 174MFSha1.1]